MAHGQSLALDQIDPGGRDVEQQVNEMILEQIGLVDVEEAAVGRGEQAGLEMFFAGIQRAFQIERSNHTVLCGAKRKVDDRRAS